eukprot:TRINITY_DN12877_c0_g2_i3.p2 TRINITY_DN12877_c0_g2~~TRINITY_DN12877_c0_g2_i3.p2  ORF type:complete len:117 (+),score=8.32 TRINITY_DN12877_c0_g2_i3:71-421(+)
MCIRDRCCLVIVRYIMHCLIMGSKVSNRKQVMKQFKEALKKKEKEVIKEFAYSEQIGDANMLNMAIREGHIDMLKYLLDCCSILAHNRRCKTCLQQCIWTNSIGMCTSIRYMPYYH